MDKKQIKWIRTTFESVSDNVNLIQEKIDFGDIEYALNYLLRPMMEKFVHLLFLHYDSQYRFALELGNLYEIQNGIIKYHKIYFYFGSESELTSEDVQRRIKELKNKLSVGDAPNPYLSNYLKTDVASTRLKPFWERVKLAESLHIIDEKLSENLIGLNDMVNNYLHHNLPYLDNLTFHSDKATKKVLKLLEMINNHMDIIGNSKELYIDGVFDVLEYPLPFEFEYYF